MVEAGNTETFDPVSSDALALIGVPIEVTVPCMTMPWQIAQKLHACTRDAAARGPTIARTISSTCNCWRCCSLTATSQDTRVACVAVFEARAEHPWPPTIEAHPHWAAIYDRAREGLDHIDLAETVAEAADRVQRFVARIDQARPRNRPRAITSRRDQRRTERVKSDELARVRRMSQQCLIASQQATMGS